MVKIEEVMTPELSIIIPTYNRAEKLAAQLSRIYGQAISDSVEIVVLDNSSDYNIYELVNNTLSDYDTSNLTIIRHPYNLGGNMNIGLSYYYCKTKWLWLMSDDDYILEDSISQIYSDIKSNPDLLLIKYSLSGFPAHDNIYIENLNELVDYYKKKNKSQGELIFMSNAIFNMEKLSPIAGRIIENAYNSMPGLNPILMGLDSKLGKCLFSEKRIVDYIRPDSGSAWNFHLVSTRLVALMDYPFNENGKTMLRVMSLMNHFKFSRFLRACADFEDRTKAYIFYRHCFSLIFQVGPIKIILYKIIYYFSYILNFSNIRFVYRLYKKRKSNIMGKV